MIEVYHLNDSAFFDDNAVEQKEIDSRYYNVNVGFKTDRQKEAAIELFNSGYYFLVAVVETDSLDHAWQQTNHIDKAWYENKDVQVIMNDARSSKVGDVMRDSNGKYHIVSSIGFTEVEAGQIKDNSVLNKIRRP